jgi:hypothetical protein
VCKAMSAPVARWAALGWGRVCSLSRRAAHEGDTEYSEEVFHTVIRVSNVIAWFFILFIFSFPFEKDSLGCAGPEETTNRVGRSPTPY